MWFRGGISISLRHYVFTSLSGLACLLLIACTFYDSEKSLSEDQERILFHSVEQVSIETYRDTKNCELFLEEPAALDAKKIATVEVNLEILEQSNVSAGDVFSIELFNDDCCKVLIDKVEYNETLIVRGHVLENSSQVLFLSFREGEVFATLDLTDEDTIYSFLTDPCSNQYYLYKAVDISMADLRSSERLYSSDEEHEINNNEVTEPKPDEMQQEENGEMLVDEKNDRDKNEYDHLFLSLEEMSRNEYKNIYGEKSLSEEPITAVSERLGRVTINHELFEPGFLQVGDYIFIPLFAGDLLKVKINVVTEGILTEIGGQLQGASTGNLFLSVSERKVLATIEQPEENSIYLIRFNPVSGEHYLFKAPLDEVETLPH